MNYKGFYVWYNSLQSGWVVQAGYDYCATYSTIGGAKSAITQKWSKQQ